MNALSRWTAALALVAAGCQTQADELGGLAELPPLDCAVLVTGGAFLVPDPTSMGTFANEARASTPDDAIAEAIPIDAVVDVLQKGSVFQRVEVDGDPSRRRLLRERLGDGAAEPDVLRMLEQARDAGFDYVLVVEDLQDGPIDRQGTNGRWPLTFATWVLLGVGALIPDRTFESRATLRVTVRDLQNGRVLHDPLLVGGPIELALVERTDITGLVESVLVPPFWVGDDPRRVGAAVRDVTRRRLLLSLARDLKSEPVRQRLRDRGAARLVLVDDAGAPRVAVDATESLAVVRLRGEPGLPDAAVADFASEMLGSRTWDGERFHYEARLPAAAAGRRVQVLVATIRGSVASATFAPRGGT